MTLPCYLQPRPAARAAVLRDDSAAAYRPLLGRWLIDLALLLGWAHAGRRNHPLAPFDHHHRCWDNDEFLALTGLADRGEGEGGREGEDEFGDPPSRFRSPARFVRLLKKRRRELAGVPLDPGLPLVCNIGSLAGLLELTPAEQAALCFALLLESDPTFKRAIAQQSQPADGPLLHRLLAGLTGLPAEAFRVALGASGVLSATGLLKVQERNVDLDDKLDPGKIAHILLAPHADAEALMACILKRVTRGALTVDRFPHLARDTEVAVGLLRAASRERVPGTNLLLYGPPGVGKTEYAAALAQAVGAALYEVECADEDGDPLRGEGRLQAFNLGQRLLARRDNALLLFDEVEDVFKTDPLAELFGGRRRASGGKAWTNRALESNPVPTLWLTNHAEAIDAAHLRRFDYSIRFSLPPQSVRLAIARHHLGEWAGEDDWLARIAAREHLTPAPLERAAKVARHAGAGDPDAGRALVSQTLERSAALLGQTRVPARTVAPTGYDPRLLNVDLDIPKLIAALRRRPQGAFCFHGPAGTGKSALARHLADALDMPPLVKRASDLLDPYVGGTEGRLAAMFDEARQREAVLVLDEADSFLRERREARQAWEITQVNELLTQMEAFEGIFIATTNRMDTLDAASLRRFPWKVRFGFLKPPQRWALFAQEFLRLGGELAEALALKDAVLRLEGLAPGDAAAVVRQCDLWDETPSARDFYRRLAAEVAAKAPQADAVAPARADRRPSALLYD